MHTVVIVIHLMLVVAMIGVVMLQKSEGGGLGIGSSGGFMTNRGTANVLTRATAILAAGFFVTSLVLSIIAGHDRKPTSILSTTPTEQGGGILNQIGGGQTQQPAQQQSQQAPAGGATEQTTPNGPQVPQSK
jgi:preprotein translocase subunit SecG